MVKYNPGDILQDQEFDWYSLVLESNEEGYSMLDLVLCPRRSFWTFEMPKDRSRSLVDDGSIYDKVDSIKISENPDWVSLTKTNISLQRYIRASMAFPHMRR